MFDSFDTAKLNHLHRMASSADATESVVTRDDFASAIAEITAWEDYVQTPLKQLNALADALRIQTIYYKDEGPRFGLGSFKALGGAYAAARVLQREIQRIVDHPVSLSDIREGSYASHAADITLVSATDGNHGRSLSWGCQRFGAPCRIYIHRDVSENRADAMRQLGADVIRIEGDYDDSVRIAKEDADRNDWFVVSDTSWEGYTDPPKDVMAGYGVMVHEVTSKLELAPSHVFLQGGVGGLAASVAAGLKQYWGESSPRVVVVEPELAACLFASAAAGEATAFQIHEETMMAGLSCGEPSPLAWQILCEEASDFVTIPESIVAPTMRLLGRPLGNDPAIIGGESAVAGLAALISIARNQHLRQAIGLDECSTALVLGTEGATDHDIYDQILAA